MGDNGAAPEVLMAKKAKRPKASRSKNNNKARAALVPAKSANNLQAAKELSSKGETSSNGHSLSVVGVGASAGGLEAFEQLLRALPDDTGLAFVLRSEERRVGKTGSSTVN